VSSYKLAESAKEDLIQIYEYGFHKFGEQQADKYFERFFQYFDTIAQRPYSFESVDYIKLGYRKCPCGVDTIFYKINEDQIVEIMAIIGRQEIEKWI